MVMMYWGKIVYIWYGSLMLVKVCVKGPDGYDILGKDTVWLSLLCYRVCEIGLYGYDVLGKR